MNDSSKIVCYNKYEVFFIKKKAFFNGAIIMTLLLHDIRRKEQRDDVKKENEDGYNNEMGRLEHKSPSYTHPTKELL